MDGVVNAHQFELRVDLVDSPFPVGQTLRVSLPVSDSREVLTVNRDALVLRAEGQSVFVVNDDNTAKQVQVRIGVGQGEDVEVIGDVQPGDRGSGEEIFAAPRTGVDTGDLQTRPGNTPVRDILCRDFGGAGYILQIR